ncbi:hypothetical protein GOHSU_37_00150 [Gordonia hirsuta DSM 44140 = NBRC 16056]|uniref:Uncharacterized protein n=1 Tax=Gordonia hirsuta DSM 44140 = NBRC 16056 TaxID=1121927 RepID=L7LBK9_9ACTN|nr:hypothetical protein GOHSU_37_00150 [Gordonia hirsuta DSM 44140 = NBRC 16056]
MDVSALFERVDRIGSVVRTVREVQVAGAGPESLDRTTGRRFSRRRPVGRQVGAAAAVGRCPRIATTGTSQVTVNAWRFWAASAVRRFSVIVIVKLRRSYVRRTLVR